MKLRIPTGSRIKYQSNSQEKVSSIAISMSQVRWILQNQEKEYSMIKAGLTKVAESTRKKKKRKNFTVNVCPIFHDRLTLQSWCRVQLARRKKRNVTVASQRCTFVILLN